MRITTKNASPTGKARWKRERVARVTSVASAIGEVTITASHDDGSQLGESSRLCIRFDTSDPPWVLDALIARLTEMRAKMGPG